MLIAALLFIAGFTIAYYLGAIHIVFSSTVILIVSVLLFSTYDGIGQQQILVIFAYLAAHQAGFVAGSYLG
jgi:hypothetical protein